MSSSVEQSLVRSQYELYAKHFDQYGVDPRALCWNDLTSQELRFRLITELFKYERTASINVHEVGCGLGDFGRYLLKRGYDVTYSGNDIVDSFVEHCKNTYPQWLFYREDISKGFESITPVLGGRDFYCLSGTFHTKQGNEKAPWEEFVFKTIMTMFRMAKKGICFNLLTSYADYYDPLLYYADPKIIFDWCVRNLGRYVSIVQDAPLFEFFVYVYKPQYIIETFPEYSGKYY